MSQKNRLARKAVRKSIRRANRKRKEASRKANKEVLAAIQNEFLPDDKIFAKLKFHGNTTWSPSALIWMALYWSLSEVQNLTHAFTDAMEQSVIMTGTSPLSTYQGFMWALVKWTPAFIELLCHRVQAVVEESGSKFWRVGEWVPIAFDGSRSTAPRTKSNEKNLCAPNYGKGTTARHRKKKSKGMRRKNNQKNKPQPQEPQAWITMMYHTSLRLPWMWRLGPSNSSEREHVMDMVSQGKFPKNTMFCGDAGFVGYALWKSMLDIGQNFIVRVGANVNLLSEVVGYSEQEDGTVLCWPKDRIKSGEPPLRLRLVNVRFGKTKVWLLTSVLDSERLDINQMKIFYELRWRVEVEFRGLKQTMNRAKLRCHNSQRLLAELNWAIMAMTLIELFALQKQLSRKCSESCPDEQPPDPKKRSLANVVRAFRQCLRRLDQVPREGKDLHTLLEQAVTDSYVRKAPKEARYRPPNPDKKPLGDPKVRTLTDHEREKLAKIDEKLAV